jgi:hypothetical protein
MSLSLYLTSYLAPSVVGWGMLGSQQRGFAIAESCSWHKFFERIHFVLLSLVLLLDAHIGPDLRNPLRLVNCFISGIDRRVIFCYFRHKVTIVALSISLFWSAVGADELRLVAVLGQ